MISHRAMRLEDHAFVRSAWRESFLAGGYGVKHADRGAFNAEMARVCDRLLPTDGMAPALGPDKRSIRRCRVAFDEQDEDNLLGFAAFSVAADHAELHYIYVKRAMWKCGVAKDLLSGLHITSYTFKTSLFMQRMSPDRHHWKFTPRFTL